MPLVSKRKRTMTTDQAVALLRQFIEGEGRPATAWLSRSALDKARLATLGRRIGDEAESIAGILHRLGIPARDTDTSRYACLERLLTWARQQRNLWLEGQP